MEGICVNVVNPVHFFQFLKGRCHGNQFSGKNGAKMPTSLPALIALSFQNVIFGIRKLQPWGYRAALFA